MPKENPQQDVCDLRVFLSTILRLRKNWPNPHIDGLLPADVVCTLTRLARVSDDELFQIGIKWSLLNAQAEAIQLSQPVYRRQFINKLDEVKQAATLFGEQMRDLLWPRDSVTFLAQKSLSDALNLHGAIKEFEENPLEEFADIASSLLQAITLAKKFSPARS